MFVCSVSTHVTFPDTDRSCQTRFGAVILQKRHIFHVFSNIEKIQKEFEIDPAQEN